MNGFRLCVQFRSFFLNPQHFKDQTFEFATAKEILEKEMPWQSQEPGYIVKFYLL